jgi:putative membrane protein
MRRLMRPQPFGGRLYDGGPGWVHWLFVFLIVVAVVVGILLIVRMWAARPNTPTGGWRPGGSPPPSSPAISELDLRYARGEIGREEFLQRRADLLGHVPPPPGTPGAPPGAPPPPA